MSLHMYYFLKTSENVNKKYVEYQIYFIAMYLILLNMKNFCGDL